MDLHAWITQQVERVEESARAQLKGQRVAFKAHDDNGPVVTGTITGATKTAEGLQLDVAQYGDEPVADAWADFPSVAAVLRRCEADRRILARHRLDPDAASTPRAAACDGCGYEWVQDYCDPITDNLNDCPELLDLAHAHGITPEILAGLDRPQAPERAKREPHPGGILGALRESFDRALTRPITTSDVPAALRGPHWKP